MKKNVYVVIASHGEYAAGIVSALKLLVDTNIKATALCAYCGDINNTVDIMDKLRSYATESLADNTDLVVFTDIFGGSVTNSAAMVMADYAHMHVVAGVTLAMMMEFFLTEGDEVTLQQCITASLEASRDSACYLNEIERLKKKSDTVTENIEKDFF